MFATINTIEGKLGEKRMVITLNGKVGLATSPGGCCFTAAQLPLQPIT